MTDTDQASQTGAPTASRPVASAVRMLAKLILLAIVVQFALGGLGMFDTAHSGGFRDTYFTVHDNFALVITGLMVVMLIVALATRSGRMVVWESLALALLTAPVQHELATRGAADAPWVGSLHVVTGLLILAIDAHVAYPGIGAALRSRNIGADTP